MTNTTTDALIRAYIVDFKRIRADLTILPGRKAIQGMSVDGQDETLTPIPDDIDAEALADEAINLFNKKLPRFAELLDAE